MDGGGASSSVNDVRRVHDIRVTSVTLDVQMCLDFCH